MTTLDHNATQGLTGSRKISKNATGEPSSQRHSEIHNRQTNTSGKQRPESRADQVFFKLGLLYGHAWSNQLKNPSWVAALKSEWQTSLNRLSSDEIRQIFHYLRSAENQHYVDFPPSPLQFLNLAYTLRRQHLPDEEACYRAACSRRWEFHPVVRPIVEACGMDALGNDTDDREKRLKFSEQYQKIVRRFLGGKPLVEKPVLSLSDRTTIQKRRYPLSWAEINQQRGDRILAIPGVRDKIRAAKRAKEKMKICEVLLEKYAPLSDYQ